MSSTEGLTKEARVGATRQPDGSWEFLLWAPQVRNVSLHLLRGGSGHVPMEPVANGYYRATIKSLVAGSEYFYQLDERELPDPASRFQAQDVHGPSRIVDLDAFNWTDQNWKGISLERSIFYELHVGAFTPEGTFDGVIQHLPDLVFPRHAHVFHRDP